jgi:glycosyltransferase involved in cell wall biosynthesis
VALVRSLEAEIGDLRLLAQDRNRGKGAAVRAGIAASTGDIVVIQDADLEYDPYELPLLLEPILQGVMQHGGFLRSKNGLPPRDPTDILKWDKGTIP